MPMDGQGGIGTCPNCTLMMLRVGDAFVPELNTWAMAVTYATDIGASVVNISGGGGLDNPQLVTRRDGVRLRQRRHHHRVELGLDSFHHNYPNTSQHAISVHAITYDAQNLDQRDDVLQLRDLHQLRRAADALDSRRRAARRRRRGAPGGWLACSTPRRCRRGCPPSTKPACAHLTAEEVRQIFIGTSDNFYDPADATDPTKFPTTPPQPNGLAFARRFGYGRPNLRSAVDAILAGGSRPRSTSARRDGSTSSTRTRRRR